MCVLLIPIALSLLFFFHCLQLMSAIEYGAIVNSRFAKALQDNEEKVRISPERSGGGV